ncbi:head GIN domain-containing protein [Sphingomonas sp.]|uniref:head GIN domain-containing protein n=1 Tax=Sphingomonas sp. TaxID=28214 RepID=UPI002DD64915|nr:head GIN domain-containing protein [Sphingomonas sp.]
MMVRAALVLLPLLSLAAPARADERRILLSAFDRIRVDGPFEVTVTTGKGAGATAIGDTRALDGVSVRLQGSTLIVGPSVNGWGGYPGTARTRPRVVVTVPALRAAAVVGGGRLSVDRMAGQRVELNLTGAGTLDVARAEADRVDGTLIGTGRMTLAGKAMRATFQSNGAGGIDAAGLDARDLTVNWQSAGDGSFTARETAEVMAMGQGAITVAGGPACTVKGSGPVTCGRK